MSTKRFQEIESRLASISLLPWTAYPSAVSTSGRVMFSVGYAGGIPEPAQAEIDTNFIANAPDDMRFLLDFIEEMSKPLAPGENPLADQLIEQNDVLRRERNDALMEIGRLQAALNETQRVTHRAQASRQRARQERNRLRDRLRSVQSYIDWCGIMRVEPTTSGLKRAMDGKK